MNNDSMSTMILMALAILVPLVLVLFFVLYFVGRKDKDDDIDKQENNTDKTDTKNVTKSYNKQSIFKFMNFDKIEDNMIIQNSGKRYLMIISCQGINYDLMSGLEKNSVEQGFLQFLNTLRHTIQIYIQTRTVNLTSSISTYKDKVEKVHSQLIDKQNAYNEKLRSGMYEKRDLEKEKFELVRLRNLYEYGADIVSNTEKMSLNKNILSKFYYIIVPYYSDESGTNDFNKQEISNIAFSELYTRAQGIINSLAVCGVSSKIMDSMELTELLYAAFNRDESEAISLQRALGAGFDELYSTAPNVLDRRMEELNNKIERKATEKANDAIFATIEEQDKQKKVQQVEDDIDELIDQMAISLINENKASIGNDVAQEAVKKITDKKTEEKGEIKDGKKATTKTTRRRVTRTA